MFRRLLCIIRRKVLSRAIQTIQVSSECCWRTIAQNASLQLQIPVRNRLETKGAGQKQNHCHSGINKQTTKWIRYELKSQVSLTTLSKRGFIRLEFIHKSMIYSSCKVMTFIFLVALIQLCVQFLILRCLKFPSNLKALNFFAKL